MFVCLQHYFSQPISVISYFFLKNAEYKAVYFMWVMLLLKETYSILSNSSDLTTMIIFGSAESFYLSIFVTSKLFELLPIVVWMQSEELIFCRITNNTV